MIPLVPQHEWNVTPKEARVIQEELRGTLVQAPLAVPLHVVAGADVSFNKFEKEVYAGIIVLTYPELAVIEYSCIKMEVNFPYIPGLLSFRESLPCLKRGNLLHIVRTSLWSTDMVLRIRDT